MKVGIVTIIDNNNYGNRLQNYALQEIIKKLGFESITLKNEVFLNDKIRWCLGRIKHLRYKNNYSTNEDRKLNFQKFNRKISFSSENLNPWCDTMKCDYYVVGSDQVWNPCFGRLRDIELLRFSKENRKKISYAASFGVSTLDDKLSKSIRKDLLNFKKISVREDVGRDIIEKITKRQDIEVVLDPTMLLETSDWDALAEAPQYKVPEKYILCYFLGGKTDTVNSSLREISENRNYELVDILDEKSVYYTTGPSEFLYLIREAELICTDSFHASVFSVLYNKPFVIFERRQGEVVNMNSRITTLIQSLKLTGRTYNGRYITEENLNHDYSEAYEILDKEKKRSVSFLRLALRE